MITSYLAGERPLYPIHRKEQKERRREERVEISARVLVEVAGAEKPEHQGLAFHSEILNASSNGLRLTVSQPLDGCRLELWVGLEGYDGKLFLAADVVWTSVEDDGTCQMGVEVVNQRNTDYNLWHRLYEDAH